MCRNAKSPYLVGLSKAEHRAIVFQADCDLWECAECAERKKAKWVARAIIGSQEIFSAGTAVQFVTVTCHPSLRSFAATVAVFPHAWSLLYARMKRQQESFEYLMIMENHKNGRLHAHMLTSFQAKTRWWKDNARQSGFGYMAKESDKTVEPAKAGFYIGKYLFKQLQRDIYPRGYRRIRCSRLWPKLSGKPRDENWQFYQWPKGTHIEQMASRLANQGYGVVLADDRASWNFIATGELTENCQALTMELPHI